MIESNSNSQASDDTLERAFDLLANDDEAHFASFKISLADYPLILIFGLLFSIVFLQFFSRYVLNDSIAWTEEASRYLLIIITFAGAARCQIKHAHITLEFMDKFYGKMLPTVKIFSLLCVFFLLIVIGWSAISLIERTSFQQMVSLPFPKYFLYASVVGLIGINIGIILFQLIANFRR